MVFTHSKPLNMNGVSRSLCTFEDIRNQEYVDRCRGLRLTLHDQTQPGEHQRDKPVGRAFALVQPSNEKAPLTPEPVKSKEEQVEVIKVYLEARRQEQQKHQQSLQMLSDEVSQIQEVRYSLKTLREQMAAKNKTNGWRTPFKKNTSPAPKADTKNDAQEMEDEAERAKLREVSKRLYAQLQEAEKKHQEEKERLQAEGNQLKERLSHQEDKLKSAEEAGEEKDKRIDELQRLLGGMEQESSTLREAIRSREEELLELRRIREEGGHKDGQRTEQLEKEVAVLKEKIHHLDDMLKSQQRKVRHMIEQLQNSRMVIQERDRVIKELEEKVAFLEAENREMHDQVDYFLGSQRSNSYLSAERNPQIVYSKPIKPTTSSNKPLPFIKVIEIKS
ncbi:tuftelin 1a [Periophthalmus magnuspinnatus]|uniref:tuftelin 1a n=1 Tax=Periophthalmus magnuspinnatus TaxID=409849 RepID=UPI00145C07DA|nr:tuftelin 1a [Periophthalmus magnuspinnatus]